MSEQQARAKRKAIPYLTGVVSFAIGLVVIFPIAYAFFTSFMTPSELASWPPRLLPESFNIQNYITVFSGTMMPRYMLNSLILATGGTLLRLITSSLAGFSFAFHEYRFKNLFFFLILGSMMIPGDAIIISNYIIVSRLGLMDTYAGLISVYGVSAIHVFMMRQYMKTLPRALYEAAMIDGCGDFKFFLTIALPCSVPILIALGISSFVNLWNAYLWPLMITNTASMRVVQVGVTMLTTEDDPAYHLVMAAVAAILIPSILVFVIFQRKIVGGITAGSSKG